MEILYFSSGVFIVAFLYAVISVFKLRQQIDFLKIETDQIHNLRKIEIGDIDRQISELAREIATAQDELYRFVDSRVDKLEDRLTKNS